MYMQRRIGGASSSLDSSPLSSSSSSSSSSHLIVSRSDMTLLDAGIGGYGGSLSEKGGPRFLYEPPSRVEFSNSTGSVIPCSTQGSPSPLVRWEAADSGQVIADVPGLRHVRPDGSLVLPPFRADDFRPDVHASTYRCVASNAHGTVASRNVQVRAGKHY